MDTHYVEASENFLRTYFAFHVYCGVINIPFPNYKAVVINHWHCVIGVDLQELWTLSFAYVMITGKTQLCHHFIFQLMVTCNQCHYRLYISYKSEELREYFKAL